MKEYKFIYASIAWKNKFAFVKAVSLYEALQELKRFENYSYISIKTVERVK